MAHEGGARLERQCLIGLEQRSRVGVAVELDPVGDATSGEPVEAREPEAGAGLLRALEAPIRQIAENAGNEGSIVVGKITDNKSQTYGFNAQTEEYVDMIEAGIVDPAKVVRTALQDAASVAGLLITTEAMIGDKPKKEAPAMPMGAGGGGMGGMDF